MGKTRQTGNLVSGNILFSDITNNRLAIGTTSPDTIFSVQNVRSDTAGSGWFTYTASATAGKRGLRVDTNNGFCFDYYNGSSWSQQAAIDSSGRLLVGTSSARSNFFRPFSATAAVQIEGTSGNLSTLSVVRNSNDSSPSYFVLGKSRGTANASNTIVQSNDAIGVISFQGTDGGDMTEGARISAEVDGTPGTADMPCRLIFQTTADGASSPTERMRITNSGLIAAPSIYNTTTASAANVFVDGSGALIRSTSSAKYKTDIESIDYSYSANVLNCRPVWYRSKSDADNPNWGWWGFIAEEVAAIDPRLVHWKTVEIIYDENGSVVQTPCEPKPEGVAYDRFVPHLLNLIKRQKEQIEAMEARLSALEAS